METSPWWTVDLEVLSAVSSVRVYNRRDCCSERLHNFEIRVGPYPELLENPARNALKLKHSSFATSCALLQHLHLFVASLEQQHKRRCARTHIFSLARTRTQVCATNISAPVDPFWVEVTCLEIGRYVSIRLHGAGKVLSLCEVQGVLLLLARSHALAYLQSF